MSDLDTNNYSQFLCQQSRISIEVLERALADNNLPSKKEHIIISTSGVCYQIFQQFQMTYEVARTCAYLYLLSLPIRRTIHPKRRCAKYMVGHLALDISRWILNIGHIALRVSAVGVGVFSKRNYVQMILFGERVNDWFHTKKEFYMARLCQKSLTERHVRKIDLLAAEFGLGPNRTEAVFLQIYANHIQQWRAFSIEQLTAIVLEGIEKNQIPITLRITGLSKENAVRWIGGANDQWRTNLIKHLKTELWPQLRNMDTQDKSSLSRRFIETECVTFSVNAEPHCLVLDRTTNTLV
jgi:hypothetical protein